MKKIIYLTTNRIKEINLLSLTLFSVKKKDKPELLSKTKLEDVLDNCEEAKGDIYDKAIVLLKGLIQKHPFASGNRRTAFLATKEFLKENRKKVSIKDNPNHARVMQGIRENFYKDEEIKEWLKHGKIKKFKR